MHNQHGVPPDQPSLAYKISHSNDSDAKNFRLLVNLKTNPDYETKEQPTKNQLTADLPLDTLETPLGKAYSVFNRKLSQMTDPEHLARIQKALLRQLTTAVIQAQTDEPTVYTMFARLNAAGSKLSTPDLDKAETFRQIKELPERRLPYPDHSQFLAATGIRPEQLLHQPEPHRQNNADSKTEQRRSACQQLLLRQTSLRGHLHLFR